MTFDSERKKELDHAWIESLLHEALNREHISNADRIQSLFSKPNFEFRELHSSAIHKHRSFVRWLPLAIAASLAVVLGAWLSSFSNPNQLAYAAIARSLQATPVAREYSIRIIANTLAETTVTKTAQLFVDSSDRFVVHRQGWGLGDVWFGNDGSNHWVVPRFGPAVKGSERILGSWLMKKDATTPYLHIKTILKRMEKEYRVSMLPDAVLTANFGQGDVLCERVRGEWKGPTRQPNNSMLPATIELWADKGTGIAHRVVLAWNLLPTQIGPLEWTIDLKGFPSLADNWFDPSGHTAAGQRILSIGKESELDSFSKSNEE